MKLRVCVMAASAIVLVAATARMPSLSGYVGKYPFDTVGGVSFLTHAIVRQQVARHAPMALQKTILSMNVVGSPIKRTGTTLIAGLCEQHNCGAHNWTILVSADGARAAICHANGDVAPTGVWYQNRVRIADQTDGACPSTADTIPRTVLDRMTATAAASPAPRPVGMAVSPPAGSPERRAMLAPVRTFVEGELGSPVEFVVKTLNISGGYGFALLQPVRPGGLRLDPDTTPAAAKFHMANGTLDNFSCCETTAILQRGEGGVWTLRDIRIGATDAWYHAWLNRVPRDLFTQR